MTKCNSTVKKKINMLLKNFDMNFAMTLDSSYIIDDKWQHVYSLKLWSLQKLKGLLKCFIQGKNWICFVLMRTETGVVVFWHDIQLDCAFHYLNSFWLSTSLAILLCRYLGSLSGGIDYLSGKDWLFKGLGSFFFFFFFFFGNSNRNVNLIVLFIGMVNHSVKICKMFADCLCV